MINISIQGHNVTRAILKALIRIRYSSREIGGLALKISLSRVSLLAWGDEVPVEFPEQPDLQGFDTTTSCPAAGALAATGPRRRDFLMV
jgi:hypothetical protein